MVLSYFSSSFFCFLLNFLSYLSNATVLLFLKNEEISHSSVSVLLNAENMAPQVSADCHYVSLFKIQDPEYHFPAEEWESTDLCLLRARDLGTSLFCSRLSVLFWPPQQDVGHYLGYSLKLGSGMVRKSSHYWIFPYALSTITVRWLLLSLQQKVHIAFPDQVRICIALMQCQGHLEADCIKAMVQYIDLRSKCSVLTVVSKTKIPII